MATEPRAQRSKRARSGTLQLCSASEQTPEETNPETHWGTPAATDPALLDELPLLGDLVPDLPPALKARLLAAFGIEILWNKPGHQVTVFAEITDSTLQAIPGITDPGQDGYHDTGPQTSNDAPVSMGHLNNTLDSVERHIH